MSRLFLPLLILSALLIVGAIVVRIVGILIYCVVTHTPI